ncbi:hypothetical protein [Aeromicrobium sp. Leaf272]|uniref:hypothetical protein n=1 Tax=Aeromicrobium sp. Leaf272 TaxID=1736317 RepID=UPI0012E25BBA|nr:hypothetical protein [Aeromicrobium sp. Leaf272]
MKTRWPKLSHDAALVAVTGIVAGVLGLLGARIGASGAIEAATLAQDQASQTQIDAEMRQQKAWVYQGFLEAANAYYYESLRTGAIIADRDPLPQVGDPALASWEAARYDFQGAVNDVHAFGSELAVAKLRAVAQPMPQSLGNATRADIKELANQRESAYFRAAYQVFQDGLCDEVNLDPTRDCDD